MREKKTVFKLFFVWDFEKEERWLNEMAQEGWVLDNTGFSFYTFVRCEPGEYIIRLEMNPSSDYRAFVKELGAEHLAVIKKSAVASVHDSLQSQVGFLPDEQVHGISKTPFVFVHLPIRLRK